MSLSIRPLFESMVKQFNTITTDDRFVTDFISAVNDVMDELSFEASLLTAMTHIDSTTATLTAVDPEHTYILRPGIVCKLMETGHVPALGSDSYPRQLAVWNDKKSDFMVMTSRADQSTVDDNYVPTAEIAGLGYQGDEDTTGLPTT